MKNTVAKLNDIEFANNNMNNNLKSDSKIESLDSDELSEMLNKALLKVNILEKKLKLVDELSLEFKEKADISEIESQELVKELLYRNNVNKVVLDDLENLDMDYILESLDFSEEYLVIPILN